MSIEDEDIVKIQDVDRQEQVLRHFVTWLCKIKVSSSVFCVKKTIVALAFVSSRVVLVILHGGNVGIAHR